MDTEVKRGRGRPPKMPNVVGLAQDPNNPSNQRDFLCQLCGKTYLSNPALYLHMKVKHIQGEGKQVNGEYKRGRGRPRKNPVYGQDMPGNGVGMYGRPDPTGEMFMRSEEKQGGPTDPITGFEECLNTLFPNLYPDYTVHPLYQCLSIYSHQNTPMPPQDGSDQQSSSLKKTFNDVTRDLMQLPEGKKNMLNCEQIFALYLRDFSHRVNETYYQKLVMFVLSFRECLNIYGWNKKAENEVKDFYGQMEYERQLKERLESYEQQRSSIAYTAINNAEFAPEIANEFVTVYYDDHMISHLQRPEVIDLTQHICNWLFQNKWTCSKLSMVSG